MTIACNSGYVVVQTETLAHFVTSLVTTQPLKSDAIVATTT